MTVSISEYPSYFDSHTLYEVTFNDVKIETLVTHDASIVNSWIQNTKMLNQCRLNRLIVGLDVEWCPNFRTGEENPVATLQLCVGKRCLIFQILKSLWIPKFLTEFLRNPYYRFVGVGINHDVKKLMDHHSLEVANTYDLRCWAAKELGENNLQNSGLAELVNEILGKEIEKPMNVTLSRWDQPVLTNDQVYYACLDAYFSFEIGRQPSSWY